MWLGCCVRSPQEGENEPAEVVIVCEPEQASLMMGGLHPRGSLYERPVNIETAKQQHSEFRKASAQSPPLTCRLAVRRRRSAHACSGCTPVSPPSSACAQPAPQQLHLSAQERRPAPP
jgi:hypothetical protein